MEGRVCLFVCLSVGIYGIVLAQVSTICRANENFKSCGGCQKTCSDPHPNCSSQCRTGCYCPEGQVRNETGHCVKPEDCSKNAKIFSLDEKGPMSFDQSCPENEEFHICEPCMKTCDNPNPVCPAQCARGCFCKGDMVRDEKGSCVTLDKCETLSKFKKPNDYTFNCGVNQVYKVCETCEKTCSNPKPVCPTPCARGCFCNKEGLVKAPDGKCVPLNECPTAEISVSSAHEPSIEDCGSDEEYLSCGWCEPTCSEPQPKCPSKICIRGCLCRPPLLRHHSGQCVDPKDCSSKKCSSPNEEYVCRYGCERTCHEKPCSSRPRGCTLGCYCKSGLLRDASGQCVTNCTSAP